MISNIFYNVNIIVIIKKNPRKNLITVILLIKDKIFILLMKIIILSIKNKTFYVKF